jgi:hypothetical protein
LQIEELEVRFTRLYSRFSFAFTLCISLCLSCSTDDKKEDAAPKSSAKKSDTEPTANDSANAEGDNAQGISLADVCSHNLQGDKACFTCTPRELPLTRCTLVIGEFNADESCQADQDKLSCIIDDKETEFIFEYQASTPLERVYDYMPVIISLAKTLVASKVKDAEKQLKMNKLLDLLANKRKEIFTATDLESVGEEMAALAQELNPEITPQKALKVKADVMKLLNDLKVKRERGEVKDSDIIVLALSSLAAFPTGTTELSIEELVKQIESGGLEALILGQLSSDTGQDQTDTQTDTQSGTGNP